MRIALGIEYDGTDFCGWQVQEGVRTVQEELEKALAFVADHPVRVSCAGRTDTGVHAVGQVVHFDTGAVRSERNWLLGTNVNLPDDVSVNWVRPVEDEFNARFSAVARSYRYVIHNRLTRSSIYRNRTSWFHKSLDIKLMQQAADYLIGEHDFSSFRAVACQAKHPVRTIHSLQVSRHDEFIFIDVRANAFLHHMVRNIAGVLMAVGTGDELPGWAGKLLRMRDRTVGGVTAPPGGLYLASVEYPSQFGLPEPAKPPLF
jgi:tRNA pseudouridine38-40 synthase